MSAIDPDVQAWLDRAGRQAELGDMAGAASIAADGLALWPQAAVLWNLQGAMLLAAGRVDEGVAALERAAGLDRADPEPLRNLLSIHLARRAWARARETADRLSSLAPAEPGLAALQLDLAVQRLADGQRLGWEPARSEALELQAVHDALLAALDAGVEPQALPWVAAPVFMRLLAREPMERLGSLAELGRRWARLGDARNFLMQLPRARAVLEDRLELVAQHRLWGEQVQAAAARSPIAVASPRPSAGKIRLGFKSSDLRRHAVGAFASPLFEHLDAERFEVFVYSFFPGPPDAVQTAMAGRVTAYRHAPGLDAHAAAQLIAADGLDVLFDLGGPTGWSLPEAMAWRLAPLQVSWLGYPHSLGLSTIDHILLDPLAVPKDPALLIETPLLMPRSWIAMSGAFFAENPAPAAEPPQIRNGFVTFGTANASYKYSQDCMDLWGRVLAAVPGSRFLFVRPEADAPSFRARALSAFAEHGISSDRVLFTAVRGGHLPFYGRMDISLDTAPVTGGTTTCESLWMGVPVVSLVGEALYERLSYSILTHAGLADLAVDTPQAYVDVAAALAADTGRLRALRTGLREQIRSGPLGDTAGFARDFYDLIAATVAARRGYTALRTRGVSVRGCLTLNPLIPAETGTLV